METASKMVEKAVAFASGKSSTEAKEKVEVLNKDIEAGQGSSNVNSEEGQGSGIRIQNECRICQDEDYLHRLEAPCCCNGTLKRMRRWHNETVSGKQSGFASKRYLTKQHQWTENERGDQEKQKTKAKRESKSRKQKQKEKKDKKKQT
ncbi:unnamed protein product [Malus baccata var. baccata]